MVSKHTTNGKRENVLNFFSKSSELIQSSNTTRKEAGVNYLNRKPVYNSAYSQKSKELNYILNTAKSISSKPVLVTLINDGFIELARNWLSNTKHMGIHRQVLIITTNPHTKDKLLSISSEINIVVLIVEPYLQKDQYYSHVGYLRLLVRRTEILFTLLENKIETFLFESDFLWIRNPIPLLQSYANTSDMVFVRNMVHRGSTSVNGGFFLHVSNKAYY
ncbi:unnamed protein product [Mytilus coruscus]|uniref:Nucleotide-diphospho-sugar transferase domain-containing protein n=1 Tax=Mytilus coruscus TaxID=42192 RepID=A0A6J7ZTQ7_MYTCO|nr:unnamed protein product [Mytilus coruscus]